jgi:hypothetical protein
MNNLLKFPVRTPKSMVGGHMSKVIKVKRVSKAALEALVKRGYTVIIVN